MDYKIAILGNQDTILGFKALGVDTYSLVNIDEARKSLGVIKEKDYGIVFITEDWMEKMEEEISELRNRALPAIVPIPSHLGSSGYGLKNLRKIVERAVGSDILFKN